MVLVLLSAIIGLAVWVAEAQKPAEQPAVQGTSSATQSTNTTNVQTSPALAALETLEVKGRAPNTGYEREKFSNDWGEIGNCSIRELILQRDLTNEVLHQDGCRVVSGMLQPDPYTNKTINFVRGQATSQAVQIDHVVAVSDAWQKGAQGLTAEQRYNFYNDPLNLLAVDGPINIKKGNGDAATWLPPNKDYRCRYIARQIAVKQKYTLWITAAERDAMKRVLNTCPGQSLPLVQP